MDVVEDIRGSDILTELLFAKRADMWLIERIDPGSLAEILPDNPRSYRPNGLILISRGDVNHSQCHLMTCRLYPRRTRMCDYYCICNSIIASSIPESSSFLQLSLLLARASLPDTSPSHWIYLRLSSSISFSAQFLCALSLPHLAEPSPLLLSELLSSSTVALFEIVELRPQRATPDTPLVVDGLHLM